MIVRDRIIGITVAPANAKGTTNPGKPILQNMDTEKYLYRCVKKSSKHF